MGGVTGNRGKRGRSAQRQIYPRISRFRWECAALVGDWGREVGPDARGRTLLHVENLAETWDDCGTCIVLEKACCECLVSME